MVFLLIKCLLLSLVTFCGHFSHARGQSDDCVPSIANLSIASNATLWWEIDPDQPCEITSFKLDIVGDKGNEYHFTLTDTFIDLSFLEICEQWQFIVTPISHDVVGFHRILDTYIPLPPDADLAIRGFRLSFSGRSILLEWFLRNPTLGDCSLDYRLSIEDLDYATAVDINVRGQSITLDELSLCAQYQLSIRAINQAHPSIEGPLAWLTLHRGAGPQLAPILQSVDIQPTSINMTWALEGERNRCALRTFYLDGGNYFQTNVSLQELEDPAIVSVEVKSLRPNSMYLMRASVENSVGLSRTTPVAIQTLDLS